MLGAGGLFVTAAVLLYPFKKTMNQLGADVLHALNILLFGYPAKWLAAFAYREPNMAAILLDRAGWASMTVATAGALPAREQGALDRLWDVYGKSESPRYEPELESLLSDWEREIDTTPLENQ